MSESTEISALYSKLVADARNGDEAAFLQLYDELAEGLLRMADRQIGDRLRQKYSAESAVQSVLASAFVGLAKYKHRSRRELWGWIAQKLRRHIQRKVEHWDAQKRRQEPVTISREIDQPDKPVMTHEETVDFTEAIKYVLDRVSPEDARIISAVMDSETKMEVADKAGVTRWTVNRHIERLQDLFDRAFSRNSADEYGE